MVLWLVFLLFTWVMEAFGASAELSLPALTVNGETFSNAVVTPSTKGRVMVRHETGIASIGMADFELDVLRQMADAEVISDKALKKLVSLKTPKKPLRFFQVSTNENGTVIDEAALVPVVKARLVLKSLQTRLENEARAFGLQPPDAAQFLSTMDLATGAGILGSLGG